MMKMDLKLVLEGAGAQTKDVTATEVAGTMFLGFGMDEHFRSEGSAKRHYKDEFDSQAGALLAFARALRDMAEEMETRASYRIEEQ